MSSAIDKGNNENPLGLFVISFLVISCLGSLVLFFDARKTEYKQVLDSLVSFGISGAYDSLDNYRLLREQAERFDPVKNDIFLASNYSDSPKYLWLKFQTDYFFYSEVPTEIVTQEWTDNTDDILKITQSGDVVVSLTNLNLQSDFFEMMEEYDHFVYVRK